MREYPHRPVMADEVVRELITRPEGVYVDGTVGTGGHSRAVAGRLAGAGVLVSLDRDPEAVRIARHRLHPLGVGVRVVQANYAEMDEVLAGLGYEDVQGVLLDLGMSSYQLDESGRGFSFQRDEPLDMRMDRDQGVPAFDLIEQLTPRELERILRDYGEERQARNIAKSITAQRGKRPIRSTRHLANLVESVTASRRPGTKHPATRVFQALRIAVNQELDHLKVFLEKAPSLITRGGRLVVLSYHSLEDRAVKHAIREWERGCECPPDFPRCVCNRTPLFRRIHKKGLRPTKREIEENVRARSAVLRVAERI